MSQPRRGRIVEYTEESGAILTADGVRVRFGRSSCQDFEPAIGLDVWVVATKVLPVVGERATLVNLSGSADVTDPAERARLRFEEESRARDERHAARARARRAHREDAMRCDLPPGFSPGLVALGEAVPLPPVLRALAALAQEARRIAERNAHHDAAQAAVPVDLVVVPHRDPSDAPRVVVGPCAVSRSIVDPCLVPFARIDGDEPDVFAVFFHPELHRERGLLPIVYWRHDDALEFVAFDAAPFVAALAHGRYLHGRALVEPRPDLAALTGLADPGTTLRAEGDLPGDVRAIVARDEAERSAFEALVDASLGDDDGAIVAASRALEQRYRDLGWVYHLRHTLFQRIHVFDE